MLRYIGWRLAQISVTFFLFLTVVFLLFQAMPGDYTKQFIMNPRIPPEARRALQERLGLTGSVWDQYLHYVRNVFTGNLGISFQYYPREVWDVIKERLPRTAVLFLVADLLAFGVGYPLGKYIAWKRGKLSDYAVTVTGVLFYTIFTPLLALILLFVFSNVLGWFRSGGFLTPSVWLRPPVDPQVVFLLLAATIGGILALGGGIFFLTKRIGHPRPRNWARRSLILLLLACAALGWYRSGIGTYAWDIVWHMFLPVLAVTLISFGGTMLLMRDSMLEVIREDYITTAKAKGLPDKVVRDKHAARTALLPTITNFTIGLGFIVSGGIVTETMFSWKGMGLTYLEAVLQQDFPLAMGCLIFTGILVLLLHLVVDVLYAFLDPRISY
ncbi:MAG: ABC transporter permease [Candidatus Bipolaricaulota bacterium]|nr:ABC transporter permease [Candidatus Bipolaricaulota bacterium]MDW8126715.1 ABC transporter permease [Candidatus Bipolaricaulota bacterium]